MAGVRIFPGIKTQIDRMLRNLHASGAATAVTGQGPMIINERWATTVDTTNIWTATLGATGTAAQATSSGRKIGRLNAPAALDAVQLETKAGILNPKAAAVAPTTDIYQRLILEFEAALGTVANIDNTKFFMGLYCGTLPNRDANNVVGFVLDGDVLKTLTDAAGTETLTTVATPPTLTSSNKYKIVHKAASVEFYVNDVLKNTHTTNLPTAAALSAAFHIKAEDATKIDLGALRCYLSDQVS